MVKKRNVRKNSMGVVVRNPPVLPEGGEVTVNRIRRAVKEVYHTTPPKLPPIIAETTYVRRRYLGEPKSDWGWWLPVLAVILLGWLLLASYYFNQTPQAKKAESPAPRTQDRQASHHQPPPRLGQFP